MSEIQVFPYVSAIFLPVLCAAVWNWVPTRKQTRGNTFFGARVAPEFRDSSAGVAILRQFRRRLWAWTFAGAALCVLGIALVPEDQPPVFSDGPTPNSVVCSGDCNGSLSEHREVTIHWLVTGAAVLGGLAPLIAFALGRRRTLREATALAEPTIRTASLAFEDEPVPWWVGFVSWLAILGPPLIPAATLVFLALHWYQTPYFSRPDSLVTAVYGLVLGLCFGTANQWAFLFRARSSDWAPTAAASHKYRTYLGAMLAFVFGFMAWQMCWPVVVSYSDRVTWLRPFNRIAPTPIAVVFLLLLCAGGMHFWLRRHVATESGDPMADRYWKWGYFYCNPEDSALVVPARAGIGFSYNYAHSSVQWVSAAVVMATVAMLVQTFRL
jgi:hypothetical protein